jgi:signal transduction histidine kinase
LWTIVRTVGPEPVKPFGDATRGHVNEIQFRENIITPIRVRVERRLVTDRSADEQRRVLYVRPADGDDSRHERLDTRRPSWSIEAVEGVGRAVRSFDEGIDCVLAHFTLGDETALDLVDRLSESWHDPPVVVLADASDGVVPAGALAARFEAAIPLGAGDPPTDRIVETVGALVPDDTEPDVGGDHPADSRSFHEWKANILDQLFTEIPLHMFVKDRDANHVFVSEAAVDDRIHQSSDSYIGRRDIDGIVPEAEAREPYADDLSVIESGDPIRNKEEHYPTSGRWFRTSKVPWYGLDGEIAGLLGVTQEITERKEREKHLRVTTHMLRHNLRNELTVIDGGSRYLREQADDIGEPILERITRASNRLLEKLDKQQTIVELLTKRPRREPVNLAATVQAEAAAAEEAHPAATVRYQCGDAVTASAIPELQFALEELLRNAAAHAAEPDPEIAVEVERADDAARIHVEDDCPPIPDHEIGVLTGETSITQLNHGAGLGLWMVHWIVSRSGGSISFESSGDGGNVVTVTLPLAEDDGAVSN